VAIPFLQIGQIAGASGMLSLLRRASGILGLSCLLLAAVISVRVPGWTAGSASHVSVEIHHVLRAGPFLLLMAHPLWSLSRLPGYT
jgi:hypothetical protein